MIGQISMTARFSTSCHGLDLPLLLPCYHWCWAFTFGTRRPIPDPHRQSCTTQLPRHDDMPGGSQAVPGSVNL
ncbi:hypothetical protein K505DRAFT_42273 [Melanomma pulvis-pyrius CBS 109.77]|uniref:Uncharacterized protein n=1 Tax=Melanomma pulvis-pyrius CBS 109.77 TaxID=1314802 RepID=A0A6A6XBG8_9PLEO|nr:hypothetical protein K505DRAFT_42273 [Melanomma pulvis-pyrius CBS 109.77]